MYKLTIFLLFAVLAVATAQYLASPYYGGVYRTAGYNGLYRPYYGGYTNPAFRGYGYGYNTAGVYLG